MGCSQTRIPKSLTINSNSKPENLKDQNSQYLKPYALNSKR